MSLFTDVWIYISATCPSLERNKQLLAVVYCVSALNPKAAKYQNSPSLVGNPAQQRV
jgi:hypothetical protein